MQYHTVTRQTRVMAEPKKVDNAPAFKDIQEHIDWCKAKLVSILFVGNYSTDNIECKKSFHVT